MKKVRRSNSGHAQNQAEEKPLAKNERNPFLALHLVSCGLVSADKQVIQRTSYEQSYLPQGGRNHARNAEFLRSKTTRRPSRSGYRDQPR
jgi:hypothetical protein